MKRKALKIVLILSLLVLGFALSASAEFVHIEDFQSYPLTDSFGSFGWKKISDTELAIVSSGSNKYLVNKTETNSYIQSSSYIDMSKNTTVISLKFSLPQANSSMSVSLRGNGGEASNQMNLMSVSSENTKILNTDNITLEASTDGWTNVSFVFKSDGSICAYNDGSLIYKLENYTDAYKNFISYGDKAALRIYMKGNAAVDDISFFNNISINDNLILSAPVYKIHTPPSESFEAQDYPISAIKSGNLTAYMAYNALNSKKANLISAVYSDNMLIDIYSAYIGESSLAGIVSLPLPSEKLGENDILKIFSHSSDDRITPLTKPILPERPPYISIYPSELETAFDKNGVHPRLLADMTVFSDLKEKYNSGDEWCIKIAADADAIINEPLLTYKLSSGNLLTTSREALSRLTTLSLSYHMTDDSKYLQRASDELSAICAFTDWNPTHFFSCAEMSVAVTLGYDWLYNDLSDELIADIEEAIYNNSLSYASDKYNEHILGSTFFTGSGNKNLVYNGAMAVTALGFADVYPAISFSIISKSLDCIPEALKSFDPDGGWSEGTDYWRYGVNYLTMMMSGLETVYGTDFEISSFAGLGNAMNFIVHMRGPCGYNNFHDSSGGSDTPALLYLAKRYNSPDIAASRINLLNNDISKIQPLDLIYFDNVLFSGNAQNLPLNAKFEGIEAMSMRSDWVGEEGLFVSAHGGKNSGSHTHIDAGTFVYDYLGERWICDLGRESQSYESNDTDINNSYYRISAHGHNVFVINPSAEIVGQDTDADVKIISYDFDSENSNITYDMTSAYKNYARSATRQFKLNDHKSVLTIIDIIKLKNAQSGQTIEWYFHTDSTVTVIDDNNFMFTKGDKSIYLNVKPKNAETTVNLSAEPAPSPDGEASNEGITRIKVSAAASPDIMITFKFSENKIS